MGKSKLLFITHEMSPFLELTKIAEITRQLPQAMQEKGFEIRILMPRFGNINERRNRLHEVIRLSGMNIIINDNDNPLIINNRIYLHNTLIVDIILIIFAHSNFFDCLNNLILI